MISLSKRSLTTGELSYNSLIAVVAQTAPCSDELGSPVPRSPPVLVAGRLVAGRLAFCHGEFQNPLRKPDRRKEVTVAKPSAKVRGEVEKIDRESMALHFRNPDRPTTCFSHPRVRQDPEIIRAKARARTREWRLNRDRAGRPELAVIGMALVKALVTIPSLGELSESEKNLVGRALLDLQKSGFDLTEVNKVLRKHRKRLFTKDSSAGDHTGAVAPSATIDKD